MASTFDNLVDRQLIKEYPKHLKNNIHYETMMGSIAYGVSTNSSDIDIYGFSMPPREVIYPHEYGYIRGFGDKPPSFEQFQEHHIKGETNKEYDITIFNIVKFFNLCMECNPNMVESLYTPSRCVLHASSIGSLVRDRRHIFLSKMCWNKFKNYAYSQLSKMKDRTSKRFVNICKQKGWDLDISYEDARLVDNSPSVRDLFKRIDQGGSRTRRLATIKEFGYDVKFAYNIIRLLEEVQQLLEEGTMDLTRNRKMLRAIRNGEWNEDHIYSYYDNKLPTLEKAYRNSHLPTEPNRDEIKDLLSYCIGIHYQNTGTQIEVQKTDTPASDDVSKVSVVKEIEKQRAILNGSFDSILSEVLKK